MPKNDKQVNNSPRVYWGSQKTFNQQFDLTYLQKESYAAFIGQGIGDILHSINPVLDFTGKNWHLTFEEYSLGKCRYTPDEAIMKGVSYDASLRVRVVLINLQTNEEYKQEVFLGDIPQMTDKGTFIINGIERVVVNQIVRSPGVFFLPVLTRLRVKFYILQSCGLLMVPGWNFLSQGRMS